MLYALRMGSIAALFLFVCSKWTLAQSASPVPKSVKPQSGSASLFSSEASEYQQKEALRAGATTEWRSLLLQKECAVVDEQLKKSMNEANQIDEQLAANHLSMESFPDILKMLQTSRVELLIDLAGLEARRKELLKQRDAPSQPNLQPLLAKELSIAQELVKICQGELKLYEEKFRSGNASSTEVITATKELKLSELRLALAESKSAESLNVHSSELNSLILERAEKSARLAVVEKLLKSTGEAKPLVSALHATKQQINALQSLSRRLSIDIREAKFEMEESQHMLEKWNQQAVDQK